MRIELENDYVITSDSYNYVLNKKTISDGEKTKGEEILKPIAYHTTLHMVLKSYTDKVLLSSQATTLKELKNELTTIKDYIKSILE